MSGSSGSGGIEGGQYLSYALGVTALSAALALVLIVIVVCESRESIMRFIRRPMAGLIACGDRIKIWWMLLRWRMRGQPEATCINCGPTKSMMVHCCMIERCVESQRREYLNALVIPPELLTGRPLCIKCADANHYVCWVCELELAEEKKQ